MGSEEQGGTPLQTPFTLSYMRRGKATKAGVEEEEKSTEQANPYESSIRPVCTVGTVEEFWSTYNYLVRPNDLPTTTDYHFFRDGIKPTWEDPGNARGGKWIVRLPKGLASRYWEEVVLAMIGSQFTGVPDGEVCGIVISIRYSEDILGIWNRTSGDREVTERIRDHIKKILHLPHYAPMEYKPHQASLADKSSFRNTQTWKTTNRRDSGRETRRSGSWGDRENTSTPTHRARENERGWR
eukprot:Nitzschia sp. Nitz4//scaffold170_size48074//10067//10868//NITZ4_007102-RA/size48074-augustus-gene-0.29-mRNA-1//1//CDS//3329538631//221//frame0